MRTPNWTPFPDPISEEEVKLELTWTNKHLRLLSNEDGGYVWVEPSDYRVAEVRLLHDVESVGEGVTDYRPGQRVMGGSRFGGHAELVVTGEGSLVPLPDDWSYPEGAALPRRPE